MLDEDLFLFVSNIFKYVLNNIEDNFLGLDLDLLYKIICLTNRIRKRRNKLMSNQTKIFLASKFKEVPVFNSYYTWEKLFQYLKGNYFIINLKIGKQMKKKGS